MRRVSGYVVASIPGKPIGFREGIAKAVQEVPVPEEPRTLDPSDGVAFTGEGKLVRKATGYEQES